MTSTNQKSKKEQTKISLWISDELLELVEQISESYGLSRSDLIRLAIREALANRGLLSHEPSSPVSTERGV